MLECMERAVGEEAVRRLLARPPRKLDAPMEGACGYIMRLADENMASFAEALELEHAAGAPAAWECLNGKLESTRPRLTHVARFCPHCLESTRYWLDAWEVPLADACSVCGRWLVDTCSDCGCRLTWSRRKLFYCDCGTSLLAERSREAVPAAVQLSRTLVDRARGCSGGAVEILNGLTLTECLEVCRYAAAVGGRFAYRPIRLVSEMELLDRSWNTSTLAAEVLADWPNAFVRSLRDWQSQAPEERQGSLHKVFDAVYRALRADLSNPKFEFLRIAFATYVAEHWTGPIARRSRNGLTELTRTMAWVPPSIAATKLGLTVKQVRAMAAKGELPSQSRITEAGRRFIVVSSAFVQENAGRLSPGCSLRDASHVLALSQAWLRHLVPALCSDVHPPRPGGVWDVPKAWISSLKRVAASAPLVSDHKSERMCTVQLALRNKLKKNAVTASFIRAIVDGSGPQVWRKSTTTAFGKLLVRWDEVCAWEESGAAVGPAAIALPTAARMLGVKEEVVYALVRAGLVKASADRGRQKLARYTSQRWLEEFNAQYVFGRDVAAHFGRSSKWMAQCCEHKA